MGYQVEVFRMQSPKPREHASTASTLLPSLMAIFLFALLLRGLFVVGVAVAHSGNGLAHLNGDSAEYLHLGMNLAYDGSYVRDHLRSQIKGLVRPPLYPLTLAVAIAVAGPTEPVSYTVPSEVDWEITPAQGYEWEHVLSSSVEGPLVLLLAAQAFGDALTATLTAWMAWHIFRRRWTAVAAGVAMALNPTAIGLTAVVLADGPFALAVTAALAATMGAAATARRDDREGRWRLYTLAVMAGLAWGAGQMLKPALTFWPLVLPLVWLMMCPRNTCGGSVIWPAKF